MQGFTKPRRDFKSAPSKVLDIYKSTIKEKSSKKVESWGKSGSQDLSGYDVPRNRAPGMPAEYFREQGDDLNVQAPPAQQGEQDHMQTPYNPQYLKSPRPSAGSREHGAYHNQNQQRRNHPQHPYDIDFPENISTTKSHASQNRLSRKGDYAYQDSAHPQASVHDERGKSHAESPSPTETSRSYDTYHIRTRENRSSNRSGDHRSPHGSGDHRSSHRSRKHRSSHRSEDDQSSHHSEGCRSSYRSRNQADDDSKSERAHDRRDTSYSKKSRSSLLAETNSSHDNNHVRRRHHSSSNRSRYETDNDSKNNRAHSSRDPPYSRKSRSPFIAEPSHSHHTSHDRTRDHHSKRRSRYQANDDSKDGRYTSYSTTVRYVKQSESTKPCSRKPKSPSIVENSYSHHTDYDRTRDRPSSYRFRKQADDDLKGERRTSNITAERYDEQSRPYNDDFNHHEAESVINYSTPKPDDEGFDSTAERYDEQPERSNGDSNDDDPNDDDPNDDDPNEDDPNDDDPNDDEAESVSNDSTPEDE